jgi:hypothetical protein
MAYNDLRSEMLRSLSLPHTPDWTESPEEEKPEEDYSRFLDVGYIPENETPVTTELSYDQKSVSHLTYILLASTILNNLYQQAT